MKKELPELQEVHEEKKVQTCYCFCSGSGNAPDNSNSAIQTKHYSQHEGLCEFPYLSVVILECKSFFTKGNGLTQIEIFNSQVSIDQHYLMISLLHYLAHKLSIKANHTTRCIACAQYCSLRVACHKFRVQM